MLGEQRLQVGLDTVFDQPRVNAQIVAGVVLDRLHGDPQLFAGFVFNHPHRLAPIGAIGTFDKPARWTHPVQRLVGTIVGVHADRPIGLEQQQPSRGRQMRGQATDIVDGALGDH